VIRQIIIVLFLGKYHFKEAFSPNEVISGLDVIFVESKLKTAVKE
jgi:hypothetical protein